MARWSASVLLALALMVPARLAADGLPTRDPVLVPLEAERYVDAMRSGGPSKDGIPSIDDPALWSAAEAAAFLDAGDRVIGVYRNGEARAYPQRVLVWHEIVNDEIGGEPVSITYCPLTGTALGFRRGDTELGVSGRLINSNLVMYDRETDSFWPQMLAAAINGPRRGAGLQEFRVVWTTWEQWRARYPETRVLSTDTGYMRNYRRDPYGSYNPPSGYYEPDSGPLFPLQNEDDRYPDKREIFGFRTQAGAVAVDGEHLAETGGVVIEHGGRYYLILHDAGLGTAWVFRGDEAMDVPEGVTYGRDGPRHEALDALESVNGFEAMWFAWAAFYSDTRVVDGS
ncbi:DUF3179 domain-containing protein [Aquisalimonas lutea]|uniref:DUF3179 domain-containing protein n=1 Tax=Aquisalimonas lutea TaxID=1327750 RepID=UPI0025B30B5E|nr:DUF3179 domain-containing protein [Aquisalimonas lutea]MDN3516452.1 DUF3179 domain-containing protein [Aquisalimonas lutea]